MAAKLALLSFEFETCKQLRYDPTLEHAFELNDPEPGESIQPVIQAAFGRIKRCLATTVSSLFHFGYQRLINVSNFMHLGFAAISTELLNSEGKAAANSILFVARFYRLEPSSVYKVTIDIEEMPNSSMRVGDNLVNTCGMINLNIARLARELDRRFELNGKIDYIPIILRGYQDFPRYLTSSDRRILEYDFSKEIYHAISDYQDIKILESKSLGNVLLLDNQISISENDHQFVFAFMDKNYVDYRDKKVLVLGGGDGSLLNGLMAEEAIKHVSVVEIDQLVMDACVQHLKPFGEALAKLEGPRHKIIVNDAKCHLRKCLQDGHKFDIIFNDMTREPISKRPDALTAFEASATQATSRWFFIEPIFNLSMECLTDNGLFILRLCGYGDAKAMETFEEFVGNTAYRVEIENRVSYIPTRLEFCAFYTIKKLAKKTEPTIRDDDSNRMQTS